MSPTQTDILLLWSLRATALVAGTVVLLIASFVAVEAFSALQHIGPIPFIQDLSWHPSEGLYNLLPMLYASLLITFGAILLSTPLGILSALFCNTLTPGLLSRSYRRMIELMAGIPSVIFGFWGLVTLVPLISRIQPPGTSLLAGIIILSLMILPTITLMAESSIAGVPTKYVQAAAALGLTKWAIIRRVILPLAQPGILSGIVLAAARAIGETMAVLMVCGNVVQTPTSLFLPVRTLTANIALEMAYAMGDHRSALFVTGLVLFLIVLFLVLAAASIEQRFGHGKQH